MSYAAIIEEFVRIAPLIRAQVEKFTPEDWDRVYVGAHKLTAELKVALANEANGGPDHVLALCKLA